MKNFLYLALIAALSLASCQTAPKAPTVAEKAPEAAPAAAPETPTPAPVVAEPKADPSSIVAGDTGFSPLAQSPHDYLSFSVHFGRPDAIKSWLVEFSDEKGTIVHTVRGDATRLPPNLTWDGNDDSGKQAAEGRYKARLTVDYGDAGDPVPVESEAFLLDITPPSGTITVSPQPFEPGDPDLMVNPPKVTMDVNVVPGLAAVTSWRLAVLHPDGRRFMDFISENHKNNSVAWNGRAQNNAALERGITYNLEAEVYDQYGNKGMLKATLPVAAAVPVAASEASTQAQASPVTVSLDGELIASTQVFFPAYSADLSLVGPAKKQANANALDVLANALKQVPGSRITVVGHANKVFWQDEAKGAREQEFTLIPLSKARAEAVRDALVSRGLEPSQFELSGVGADGALAPFSDVVNNWKNRRVEFTLQGNVTP
jgi:outer membrane protein OmpA-like peptidoglycan-associated protein